MRRRLAILACSLMVACAPAVIGTSPWNGIALDPYEPTVLSAGSSWYVTAIVSPDMFDLPMGSLTAAEMRDARVGKRYTDNVSRSFRLVSSSAPRSWEVNLALAQRVHEITATRRSGRIERVSSKVSLELVLGLEIPDTCSAGVHEFFVEIARGDLVRWIPVAIDCQ